MKILYFNIDGMLLSYDDKQKPLLGNGEFKKRELNVCNLKS